MEEETEKSLDEIKDANFSITQDPEPFASSRLAELSINKVSKYLNLSQEVSAAREEEDKDKKLLDDLNNSFEIEVEDMEAKDYVGEQAIEHYYSHYKKLESIVEKNKFMKIQSNSFNPKLISDSPYTEMLSKGKKKILLPATLGLIKDKGDPDTINIENCKYGDGYVEMLSEGIKVCPSLQVLNVGGNRITDSGALTLVKKLPKTLKCLSLASNLIGNETIEELTIFLSRRDSRFLKDYLILEWKN